MSRLLFQNCISVVIMEALINAIIMDTGLLTKCFNGLIMFPLAEITCVWLSVNSPLFIHRFVYEDWADRF